MTRTIIGIAWFKPEDWAKIVELAADSDAMHTSYAEWLADARRTEQIAKTNGQIVRRVLVDPDQLAGWCALRGRAPDAVARAEYVSERLQQQDRQ